MYILKYYHTKDLDNLSSKSSIYDNRVNLSIIQVMLIQGLCNFIRDIMIRNIPCDCNNLTTETMKKFIIDKQHKVENKISDIVSQPKKFYPGRYIKYNLLFRHYNQ